MTCPRLSLRQLLIVVVLAGSLLLALPAVWEQYEDFTPGEFYRTPYRLSEDYWLFRQLTGYAAKNDQILVLGDSVVWGEYTAPSDSLPAILNRKVASDRFANAGLNGLHPLAMEGLIKRHGHKVVDSDVILHCNLLWLSSPQRDLSDKEAQAFNHSTLIDQFGATGNPMASSVPSYGRSVSERIATATTRRLPYRILVDHVRRRYFDGQSIHQWSLTYPRAMPWGPIEFSMLEPSESLRHASVDWTQQGIRPQSFSWVRISESLQFQAFLRLVEHLQQAKNRVFVILGPFNTHLLLPEDRERFRELRGMAEESFQRLRIPYFSPSTLPSENYGDASHPLASGYEILAEEMLADEPFASFVGR